MSKLANKIFALNHMKACRLQAGIRACSEKRIDKNIYPLSMENKSEIILYQAKDGSTKIDVRLQDETVWLSQAQIVELFQTTKQNISLHIKNIFEEGELNETSTVKDSLTVQIEGKREVKRNLKLLN